MAVEVPGLSLRINFSMAVIPSSKALDFMGGHYMICIMQIFI